MDSSNRQEPADLNYRHSREQADPVRPKRKPTYPRLRNANKLSIGRSSLISNPIALLLERLYLLYSDIRQWARSVAASCWPKDMDAPLVDGNHDSQLVGSLVFSGKLDLQKPIHNMHIVFWARTWTLQWRKLGEGRSDKDGKFAIGFNLRQARRWRVLRLRFEVYQVEYRYCEQGTASKRHLYELFKSIKIKARDLTGLRYNLRVIDLFLWEYRPFSTVPRVVIQDHDKNAPEYYSAGRNDAIAEQFIPIELIKLKHLEALSDDPNALTIEQIQKDYPDNLTIHLEQEKPGYTRTDEWFGERMLNGMYAVTLEPDSTGDYWTKLFGICEYDCNQTYAFPSVRIRFSLGAEGGLWPEEIQLIGRLAAADTDDNQLRAYTPADGEKWLQAKRVARVTGALATELDDHFTATHLVAEQWAIAAYRNLRLNPIAALLFPHLKEVVLINHSADEILTGPAIPKPAPCSIRSGGVIPWLQNQLDRLLNKIVFGEGGYIPMASAITAKGIEQRVRDLLGVQDWNGWQPMQPISDRHYVAKSQNAFWDTIVEYVDQTVDANIDEIKAHWLEIQRFSEDLVKHAVPVYKPNGELGQERFDWYCRRYSFNPNAERSVNEGHQQAVSAITETSEFSNAEDIDRLKQACAYIIMQASFMHSFVNEHQYDDIGEVLYSCLGLRFGDGEDGVMAPESDMRIAPTPERATQMMWFSNLLSNTEYGFIERNEEGDINPRLLRLLKENTEAIEQGGHGVLVKDIESRTNI